ncbi:MAG: hypothetical protein IJ174_07115 [Clostridia bacterium]|nr:hypothetical protein [Clostridia bacterium]
MSAIEMKEKELTLEDMNKANGGYIVDRGFWSRYWIVSDYTGNVIDTAFFKIDANATCETRTISNQVISEEKYNEWIDRKNKGLPGPFTHND